MKAIFLSEKTDKIFRVYDSNTVCELQKLMNIEKNIYTKAAILREPALFCDVDIIFSTWGMPEFTEEEIKFCFPSLKCVFYGAGTVQKFARPFLNCGVKIFSAWAANAVPVAEMTVSQIVLSNKGYFLTNRLYHKKGNRAAKEAFKKCNGNYGETVGIIGAGMIGKLVIQMLKQYRLKVLVFDPFLSDQTKIIRTYSLSGMRSDSLFFTVILRIDNTFNNKSSEPRTYILARFGGFILSIFLKYT